MNIRCVISVGELLDKVSILVIKKEKISDKNKLAQVEKELKALDKEARQLAHSEYWIDKIKLVNLTLWDIEDKIRMKERDGKYDDEFIELARAVYVTNDKRFEIKTEINKFYCSALVEQKSYERY